MSRPSSRGPGRRASHQSRAGLASGDREELEPPAAVEREALADASTLCMGSRPIPVTSGEGPRSCHEDDCAPRSVRLGGDDPRPTPSCSAPTGLGRRSATCGRSAGWTSRSLRGEVLGLLGPERRGQDDDGPDADRAHRADRGHAPRSTASTSSSDAEAVRARVGILTETPGLYDKLSATANLDFFGRLYGLDAGDARRRGSSATCGCSRCGTGATTSPARSARA